MSETDTRLDAFLGATPRRARRQLISLAVLILALIAIAGLFVRFVAGSDDPYYVSPIETGDLTPQLSQAGIIHGQGELPITARLGGRIATLEVGTGDAVRYGQVLATIEAPGAEADLAARKADLTSAKADSEAAETRLQEASTRLARFEKVWRESGHRAPSLNEMETARGEAARARDARDGARARLEAARLDVKAGEAQASGRVIRAPFAGIVLLRDIHAGQTVVQDMPLMTLVRPGTPLTIRVPLASRAAMNAAPGAKAKVRLEAKPDLDLSAVLTRIEDENGQRLALFTLSSPPADVRPGMAARVELALNERRDVMLVPDAALEFSPDTAQGAAQATREQRDSVYVRGEDGNPRRVFVTVGGSDGGRTEVFSTQLHPGEDVIIGWREAPEATK